MMSFKAIISIAVILNISILYNSNCKSQPITVLVKEESSEGYWARYYYDDKRKDVFEKNINELRFPKSVSTLYPEPISSPKAAGYTKLDTSKYRLIEPAVKYPLSTTMKYSETGMLEREEWDTDGDQIMDMYFLYHYDKDNKLSKKQSFNSNSNEPFEAIYNREYSKDGKLVKKTLNEIDGDQIRTRSYYYNSKEQLIKSEWTNNRYTLYHYKSDLLIRKEKHMHREIYNEYYSYDSNGRIIENKNDHRTLKYQYDKDGKLIKKTEMGKYPKETYYHYEGGLPVKSETDFKNDGSIDLISKFYYDKNGYLIRYEWGYNDGKIQSWSDYTYETINLE